MRHAHQAEIGLKDAPPSGSLGALEGLLGTEARLHRLAAALITPLGLQFVRPGHLLPASTETGLCSGPESLAQGAYLPQGCRKLLLKHVEVLDLAGARLVCIEGTSKPGKRHLEQHS